MSNAHTISCREARSGFASYWKHESPAEELLSLERHLEVCPRCATEYRLYSLERLVLETVPGEPVTPGEDFFRALRARIVRGSGSQPPAALDEAWYMMVWVTARHMLPAMAMLVLLIIGATFLWGTAPNGNDNGGHIGSLNAFEEESEITPDALLESLVALEERENGR